jgi:hypothetical protein
MCISTATHAMHKQILLLISIIFRGDHKLSLAHMIRFLMVKPTHPGLNFRFDMCVTYLQLIILSVVNGAPVDSDAPFDRLHKS